MHHAQHHAQGLQPALVLRAEAGVELAHGRHARLQRRGGQLGGLRADQRLLQRRGGRRDATLPHDARRPARRQDRVDHHRRSVPGGEHRLHGRARRLHRPVVVLRGLQADRQEQRAHRRRPVRERDHHGPHGRLRRAVHGHAAPRRSAAPARSPRRSTPYWGRAPRSPNRSAGSGSWAAELSTGTSGSTTAARTARTALATRCSPPRGCSSRRPSRPRRRVHARTPGPLAGGPDSVVVADLPEPDGEDARRSTSPRPASDSRTC